MANDEKPNWAERWRWECEQAAFHAAVLLRLSGRRPVHSAVLEMFKTVPRSASEAHYPEECFFMRCGREAASRHDSWEKAAFEEAIRFFERFAAMRPARRAMIEACVAGVLVGLGMGG